MNPARKTRYNLGMIMINGSCVGINTSNPDKLAVEILKNNLLPQISGYTTIKPEAKYGDSRFDVYAENDKEKCFVEVKNVTLKDDIYARFPDAVTERGQKHLETLVKAKSEGFRAVMLYIIQRMDVEIFTPAFDIDPKYASKLKIAANSGVEIIPLQVKVSPLGIEPVRVRNYQL